MKTKIEGVSTELVEGPYTIGAAPTFKVPELSEWQCFMFGSTPTNQGIVWRPNRGCEPNWFWRQMQFLILGNRWVKDEGLDDRRTG